MDIEYTLGAFSDPHGNLPALQSVLEDMMTKYPVTKLACLGDIVGYYSQPNQVLAQVLEVSDWVVKGNHDDSAAQGIIGQDYNLYAAKGLEYSIKVLSVEEKRRLYSLPAIETVNMNGKVVEFLHGSPEYPLDQYVFDNTQTQAEIAQFMTFVNIDILFMGHTHLPYIRQFSDGKIMVNPGSAGQPRDGDPRVSYVAFDAEKGLGVIERVKYDIEQAVSLTKEAGLPDQLGERLRRGR